MSVKTIITDLGKTEPDKFDMTPEVRHDLAIEQYHANPAIGRSGLMEFLKSPQHYHFKYLSGKAERDDTTALRIGGAFHALALESHTFNDRAIIWSGKPRNTKEGKSDYEAAVAAANGRMIIKQDELQDMKDMAAALISQPASQKVIAKNGKIESSFFWTDEEFRVRVKCRPDYYRDDGIVLDLKTVEDASRDAFERSIVSYGYDIQAWMCMEGIEKCTGKRPESFVFVCVEKSKPHCVAFYVADGDLLECGSSRYAKLMSKYAECKKNDIWPGYGHLIQPVGIPAWFAKRIEKGETK